MGFRELAKSRDTWSTLGIGGEQRQAFRDMPQENKQSFTVSERSQVKHDIKQVLSREGFLERIHREQMLE